MKRSPLKRGTKQLARTTRLTVKTRVKPKRDTPRRQNREAEDSGENDWSAEVRREVRLRSRGVCEVWGCNFMADQMHHRKLRRFGDHRAVNALHVCNTHHAWIHANPYESYASGLLVRSTLDPADVPVELRSDPVGA